MLDSIFIYFFGVKGAANRFAKSRADFYEALAARLDDAKGSTLLDIFKTDATRYAYDEDGNAIVTPRATLSAWWAQRHDETGGDLAGIFQGTVPNEDVVLLGLAQKAGAGALPSTLRDLARTTELVQRAKSIFYGTTLSAMMAITVVVGALVVTPFLTVPSLKDTYSGLPVEYYPSIVTTLFAVSDFIGSTLLIILLLVASLVYFVVWSLPNLVGPIRKKLDKWLIWQLYRDFQGALFLAILSTMTKKRGNVSTTITSALEQLRSGGTPWKQWHIDQMLANLEATSSFKNHQNNADVMALNTGMIDRESFFYLLDVFDGQGMDQGLLKAGQRVEGPALKMVEAKAKWVSRLLILFALIVMGLWTYAHISSAQQAGEAMKTYYQSQ